jgi:two-component system, OmpR family, KDP operon response regulator KdpE
MIDVTAGRILRILAVDDDPVNRSLIRAILVRAGDTTIRDAVLHEATTLAEARHVLDREPIDLLLLDVHLPDGLGLDLATELRDAKAINRPAIVALTASVLPADQQKALDAGCDAFLAKPYRATELVSILSDLAHDRLQASSATRGV